ncbi:MAG: hypothetical protein ACOYJC_04790 [Christensenellales bacterium]
MTIYVIMKEALGQNGAERQAARALRLVFCGLYDKNVTAIPHNEDRFVLFSGVGCPAGCGLSGARGHRSTAGLADGKRGRDT